MENAMFRIVLAVLAILLMGAGFALLADYPAELVLSLPHWRISLSPAAALALLVALVLLLGLAAGLLKMLAAPFCWPLAWRRQKQAQARQALSTGLLAAFAGDTATAKAQAALAQAVLPAEKEPLTALLQAQIAELQQAQKPFFAQAAYVRHSLDPAKAAPAVAKPGKSRAEWLITAAAGDKPAGQQKNVAALRLPALAALYRRQQAAGDQARADRLAAAAAAVRPGLVWASMAALAAAAEAGEWDKAPALYDNFAKAWQKAAKQDKSGQIAAALDYYRQVLYCAQARALFSCKPHQARQVALAAVKIDPAFTPATALAAHILFRLQEWRKAEKLLKTQWRQEPHPDLGQVYSKAGGLVASPAKRLERAQSLAALTPDNAVAHRLVADAALAAGEDRLARERLDQAMAQEPGRQGFILLAKLAQKSGESEKSRQFLAQALAAPAEKCWCADGQKLEHWQAFPPPGRRPGACQWQSPAAETRLSATDLQIFLPPAAAISSAAPAAAAKKTPGRKNKQAAPDIEAAARGMAPGGPAGNTIAGSAYLNVDNPGVADKEE